jgi:carboxypeptidase C (cathepsin A)
MPYKDKEKKNANARAYRKINGDKVRAREKKYYENNKENKKLRDKIRYKNNKAYYFLKTYLRRNMIKEFQTPVWADMDAINTIYKQASRRSQIEGRLYHVDHIVPLNNPLVSGLHVQDNLQIILASENLSKSNQFII